MSKMREAMESQPDELARLLADDAQAEVAAERLAGRRVQLIGVGTSWHAAHHGAWMLREAGIEAEALHAADVAPYGRAPSPAQGVIVLSHTGGTGYSMTMLQRAREANAETVYISGIGNGGDIQTVAAEQSYAYTVSHTAAILVLAQIATRLGAQLGPLDAIPDRVAAVLDLPGPLIERPARLVELIGAGPNGWTAQEGALKIREASYVAAEGLSSEQFFHGPSVALDEQDTLVALDGGGPMAERTEAIAAAIQVTGAKVARFAQRELGEALSVLPLTVVVQRIAVELAEARGVSPDRFRYEEDPRREAPSRRSASRRPRTSSRASAVSPSPIAGDDARVTMPVPLESCRVGPWNRRRQREVRRPDAGAPASARVHVIARWVLWGSTSAKPRARRARRQSKCTTTTDVVLGGYCGLSRTFASATPKLVP